MARRALEPPQRIGKRRRMPPQQLLNVQLLNVQLLNVLLLNVQLLNVLLMNGRLPAAN